MPEQISLFAEEKTPTNIPLAEKIRPDKTEDIMGQHEIMKDGSQLRNMITNDNYSSFILWGPPGTGKTTIARLIEKKNKIQIHFLQCGSIQHQRCESSYERSRIHTQNTG